MRQLALLSLLLGLSLEAGALELLCKGTVSMPDGQLADHSFVLDIEDSTLAAKVWTPDGVAIGVLNSSAQSYTGLVLAPNSSKYSIGLDRYSGQLLVIQVDPPPRNSKASFWGTCDRATRKF